MFDIGKATKAELIEKIGQVPGMNTERMTASDLRALFALLNPSSNARGSKERPGVGTTAKGLIVRHWPDIQLGVVNYDDIANWTNAAMLKQGYVVAATRASVAVYVSQLRRAGKITGYAPLGRPVGAEADTEEFEDA